jgi:short-subunit dehydrogenase
MNGTALITGATSGIGLEIARLFARDGADLLLVARNSHKLGEIKDEFEQAYKIKVHFLALDLSVPQSAEKVDGYAVAHDLSIDFLVNNAGFGDFGKFLERDREKYREMISLNIGALMELAHIVIKKMTEKGAGKVLNVASTASLQPVPNMAVYGATKAFVLSFSEALNHELRNTKVSVTALLPGPTATNFFNRADAAGSRMTDRNMPPAQVAKIGYDAMLKGKRRVIAGGLNNLQGVLIKLLPVNGLTLNIIEKLIEEKNH